MEPQGTRTIASYPDYGDAQGAVDSLSDAGFPVERLRIVGSDLRSIEQVTGRRTYLTSALGGAMGGGVMGALVGLLLGLFQLAAPPASGPALAGWGLLIGALAGAVAGALAHAATGGRRDFHSFGTVIADRYDVACDVEVATEAERLLAGVRTPAGVR